MKKIKKKKIEKESNEDSIADVFHQCYREHLNSDLTLKECIVDYFAFELILDKELEIDSNRNDFVLLLNKMINVLNYETDCSIYNCKKIKEFKQEKPKLKLIK